MQSKTGHSAAAQRIAGRYRVLGALGEGGMGAVLHVLDAQSGRELALKRASERGDAQALTRARAMLEREYRTLSQLHHPSVIEVYDFGREGATPFYTMELLSGGDLFEHSPLPWREACRLLRDVCSSLALLHSRRLLHRDVSPRNIRRTQDGRAKLIDFGNMEPMGACRLVAGTPPLVAPEVLYAQELDGRCDLYSLGASLYFALTGRHAYPARRFRELPAVWQSAPPPPSSLGCQPPPALDDLVLSLLQPDPNARPQSAAEVIERLSAIAELLPPADAQALPAAFLTTPLLVGREQPLSRVRAALSATAARRGARLWVEGAAGVGRTRFLDAAVLEARTAGVITLRAGASDAVDGDYGVLRALMAQLAASLPEEAGFAAESLALAQSAVDDEATRTRLHSALLAGLGELCRRNALLVAVDDIERVDLPSRAALAALGSLVDGFPLVLVISASLQAGGPHVDLLRKDAERLRLRPLDAAESEALLRSIFGATPRLSQLSERFHALCQGVPSALMALSQHLLDSGHARYEHGGFTIAQDFEARLPRSQLDALRRRLASLGPDERELAEALAVAYRYALPPVDCVALTQHRDPVRVELALGELVAQQLLRSERGRLVFSFELWVDLIDDELPGVRKAELHLRLAGVLARLGRDAIDVARCLQAAQDDAAAVDALLAELAVGSRADTAPSDYAVLLARAADACRTLARPPRERFALVEELVRVGDHLGVAGIPELIDELFERLCEDSGLSHYQRLPESLEPGERLQRALAHAAERYAALPEHERVLAPIDAIKRLAQLVRHAAAFGAATLDRELILRVPSLLPFAALSPAIEALLDHTLPACLALSEARYQAALRHFRASLARLSEPDRAGLDEQASSWSICATRYCVGQLLAGLAAQEALSHADALERHPAWRIPAWDIRRAYWMRLGDLQNADAARLQMERQALTQRARPPIVATSARFELEVCAHADDLMGVKRSFEPLDAMAAIHPGFEPYRHYARAEYERIRGNHLAALSHAQSALESAGGPQHASWAWAASSLLLSLQALGHHHEVCRLGADFCARADAIGLCLLRAHLELPVALSEAALGEFAAARARADTVVERFEQLGTRGLNLAWVHEVRARVAIAERDQAAFVAHAARCAACLHESGHTPILAARYARLLADAHRHALVPDLQREGGGAACIEGAAGAVTASGGARPTRTRALEGLGRSRGHAEGASAALSLLLELCGASRGAIYRACDGKLQALVHSYSSAPPPASQRVAEHALCTAQRAGGQLDDDEVTQVLPCPPASSPPGSDGDPAASSTFIPLPLYPEGGRDPVAVAVLKNPRYACQPGAESLSLIAAELSRLSASEALTS